MKIISRSGFGRGKSRIPDGVCSLVVHQNGSVSVRIPLLPHICACFGTLRLIEQDKLATLLPVEMKCMVLTWKFDGNQNNSEIQQTHAL